MDEFVKEENRESRIVRYVFRQYLFLGVGEKRESDVKLKLLEKNKYM